MQCPHCQSDNVRPSRKSGASDWLYALQGKSRYRCRSCYHSFRQALPAAEKQRLRASEQLRHKRVKGGWKALTQSRRRRRFIEVTLFVGMLLIFYYTFNAFVKHGSSAGQGVETAP